jgi:hypothetical protein
MIAPGMMNKEGQAALKALSDFVNPEDVKVYKKQEGFDPNQKYEFQLLSVQINKHKTPHKSVDDTFLYLWNNGYERMFVGVLGQDPTRDSYCNLYEDWYYNKKYISI